MHQREIYLAVAAPILREPDKACVSLMFNGTGVKSISRAAGDPRGARCVSHLLPYGHLGKGKQRVSQADC